MSSRPFLFSLILLVSLSFVPALGAPVSGVSEDKTASAIAGAEEAVTSAYSALFLAEGAGADISDLSFRLNNACSLLVQARFFHGIGNFDEAFRLAHLCVWISGEVEEEAYGLRDLAIMQGEWNLRLTIALSTLSMILITCASFFGWRFFKRRYLRRVLGMKPEVVSNEP